jgi:phosphate transport system protein
MRHFEEQLEDLFKRIVMMGSIVESMIQISLRICNERNESLSEEVFDREKKVNAIQVEVDEMAVRLTTLQQPVARDARFLFMASRIGGELERIADQAINICQNSHHVLEGSPIAPLVDLRIMGVVVLSMVRNSLSAMSQRDCALADAVLVQEEQVDAFRDQIFRVLLTHMMGDPRTIQQGLSLILIARNLERIGDHATNIAEEVIYWIQGRDVRHGQGAASRQPSNATVAAARPPNGANSSNGDKHG